MPPGSSFALRLASDIALRAHAFCDAMDNRGTTHEAECAAMESIGVCRAPSKRAASRWHQTTPSPMETSRAMRLRHAPHARLIDQASSQVLHNSKILKIGACVPWGHPVIFFLRKGATQTARSSSGLGRRPLKAEITSSNLVRATKNLHELLRELFCYIEVSPSGTGRFGATGSRPRPGGTEPPRPRWRHLDIAKELPKELM